MTLKNLSEKATMKLLTSSNCEQQIVITKEKNVCFLGKNEQMIKKEEKVWPKKLLITDMKKILFVMVLQSFSFVAFISDEKKMFDKKKDNGKLFSHFDLLLKVAYQNKNMA